jgi:hypothetical protein
MHRFVMEPVLDLTVCAGKAPLGQEPLDPTSRRLARMEDEQRTTFWVMCAILVRTASDVQGRGVRGARLSRWCRPRGTQDHRES